MSEKDTILINIMYTGDYTNKNIGHEIINLYKTDKGENYIYISPYGKLADDKYGGVSTVLLARPAEKGRLEIIAKADGLTPLSSRCSTSSEGANIGFDSLYIFSPNEILRPVPVR